MYVECWSGLASRIITLAEAYYIQQRWGKGKLNLVWPVAEDCAISFYDVFDEHIFEDISWKLWEYKQGNPRLERTQRKYAESGGVKQCLSECHYLQALKAVWAYGMMKAAMRADFRPKRIYKKRSLYYDTTDMYGEQGGFGSKAHITWERVKEKLQSGDSDFYVRAFKNIICEENFLIDYDSICFRKHYHEEAEEILGGHNSVVGVQIRRTDHKASISHSLSSEFEKRMDMILEENPETDFFLATDDIEEEKRFRAKYGHKILTQGNKVWNRDTAEGMQTAVVDFLCLSKCRLILGSYNSTFGEVAAKYGGIEEIII